MWFEKHLSISLSLYTVVHYNMQGKVFQKALSFFDKSHTLVVFLSVPLGEIMNMCDIAVLVGRVLKFWNSTKIAHVHKHVQGCR